MTITLPATNALSELVDDARTLRDNAEHLGHERAAQQLDAIARTLDSARTRLVEDGADYLDAAWAFLDAGRDSLTNWSRLLDAHAQRISHARA